MIADDAAGVLADVPLTDAEWATLLCVHVTQVGRWRRGKGAGPRDDSAAGRVLGALVRHIRDDERVRVERVGQTIRALLASRGWAMAVVYSCTLQECTFQAGKPTKR